MDHLWVDGRFSTKGELHDVSSLFFVITGMNFILSTITASSRERKGATEESGMENQTLTIFLNSKTYRKINLDAEWISPSSCLAGRQRT